MRTRSHLLVALIVLVLADPTYAQEQPRTFGAGALQLDDGTGSANTLTFDLNGALEMTYRLHFPLSGPPFDVSYFAVDPAGNISWTNSTLPPLPLGNMWCGNVLGQAEAMPPGDLGAILVVGTSQYGVPAPEWATVIPGPVTISASQITSGTIQPGVTINVGPGAIIQPSGGTVIANGLAGAGPGKFAGEVNIPQFALSMNIPYTGTTASSVILVSISDPSGQTDQVTVSTVTAGVGFTVMFSGFYPTTTGELHYVVVN